MEPTLGVRFYETETGNEPVREWLKELSAVDRKTIGLDMRLVQLGWPVGMPLVRKMEKDLWEIRVSLDKRIARILFTVEDATMVPLHGFIKKSKATPADDLNLARQRLKHFKQMRAGL